MLSVSHKITGITSLKISVIANFTKRSQGSDDNHVCSNLPQILKDTLYMMYTHVQYLENNPKKICALIGLKL